MIKEELNKIRDYFVSMANYDGKWVVAVRYPEKWVAYSSDDGRIIVSEDDKTQDLWWYYAKDESVEIDDIIALIQETVQTNLEAIKKVELFKLKASELKRIFGDESISLNKLQTLRFVFDEHEQTHEPVETIQKKAQVKTAPSKKEMMSQVGEEIQEHDVFRQEAAAEQPETASEVQEPTRPKRRAQKQKEEKVLRAVTPIEMTQSDIDKLRG